MSTPEFKVGDGVRIWAGSDEGLCSPVKAVRVTPDGRHDFLTNYGWHPANNLVSWNDRRGSRYDRDGYCDNPARGF